jgi:hypothetical protein
MSRLGQNVGRKFYEMSCLAGSGGVVVSILQVNDLRL